MAEQADDDVVVVDVVEVGVGLPDVGVVGGFALARRLERAELFVVDPLAVGGSPTTRYCRPVSSPGDVPSTVMTFRVPTDDVLGLTAGEFAYFRAAWGRNVVVAVLGDHTDWTEIAELITDSYREMAPKFLVARVPFLRHGRVRADHSWPGAKSGRAVEVHRVYHVTACCMN